MDHKMRQLGPKVGDYMGKPIFKTVENQNGTYVFDRIANCDAEGCPLDQLSHNELLLEPGLIYKQID